ncbi:hypothetical protein T265_06649 [Opisthorchis viverrini]|uniref:Netrin receptor UNC5 n=1 Tax=Opisthorchis viverrini TaxID=6198 RepID=A0A074ZFP6_OPIVI|nr:hypothetical protein T265_06649 [Opisthorchis viverrini]KER26013.1 hypothetical protein T265_06649 [Opisthorchis viverrini]
MHLRRYLIICFLILFHLYTADSQKDLVQPDETHLEGVPFFLKHPKPLYYTMKGHPATIDCVAEPVSHAVIECAEQIIPYKGPDEPGRLKVTRLDSDNQPDPNGKRWHLELQVRAKEVEEWFDSYVCRCEAWNKVIELQRPKKVFSKEAVVIEAYLDRKFQLEPVSTDLSYGKRLVLTCIPPKGKPEPEVYWLKDGKRVNKDNFAHIILNDYNHLIIENVTEKDAGNYTCVAECLGMEYRYAMAKVTVTANLPTNALPVWTEWSTCSPSVVISDPSRTSEKIYCQQSRYRLCAHSAVAPISSTVKSGIETLVASCPQPWKQTRNCSNSSCPGTGAATGDQLVDEQAEKQGMERNLHTREIIIYVALFAFVACILILLVLFFCQWKGSRSFFPKPLHLPCCLPGTTAYHSEKRGIFPKDPLLLNDFKQSTMTIRNPITMDIRQKSCDGRSLGIPQTDISSQPITSLPTDHQYSLPIYDRAAISNQSSLGLTCQILENPSSFPLPIGLTGTISHLGVLPPVPSCFRDPLLCGEKCEGNDVFLQNTPYCVTSVEPLRAMLPFTQNQSLLTMGDMAGASTTYTKINEIPGRNILPDTLDLNSATTATNHLFGAHKVGSVFTEASSGKSSSNMATNTTAVGSVNADSSNGSLGIGATHSPSGLLLAQTGETVVGDRETRQYNANYSNDFNPPWNYSCEIQETDVVISANLTENGGLICSSTSGVYLKVPQGAVHGMSEEPVYVAICRDERIRPILGDHQTLLSPVVQFGPISMHPHQEVVLSFPHCAALDEGPWYLRVVATGVQSALTIPKCEDGKGTKPKICDCNSLFQEYEQGHDSVTRSSILTCWKEVCAVVSQKDEYEIIKSQPGITCHINTSEVHLLTQRPQRYCLIGESLRPKCEQQKLELLPVWPANIRTDGPAKKMLRLTAYSARPTPTMDYNIRVYILPDIQDILEHVKATELRLDGYVLDTTDPLPFYDTGQGMCFSIEDVSKGWRSRLHMNTQEVPFRHIWGGTQLPTLHCAFTLEHIDHTQNSVSCRIIAFQGMNWEQRKVLHISSDCIDNVTSNTNTVPVAIPNNKKTFFRIKDSTREIICDFMNMQNNWQDLAKGMKLESHVPYLANLANPTESLLNLWEAAHRQDQYLGGLKNIFCQLGLTDFATSLAVEPETFWDVQ